MDSFFKWFEELFWRLGTAYEKAGFAGNYFSFLRTAERSGNRVMRRDAGVTLRNVSFRYPSSGHDAVCNVSLQLPPGKTVAIVGRNGAGKSTLARLISGQYHPASGNVIIGGVDTINGAGTERITAVYQTFERYRLSLAENIAVSDGLVDSGYDSAKVRKLVAQVGLAAKSNETKDVFVDGIDTMLSREFGGVDLSKGEWQRVSIARGLYRDYDTIVLDEPTASIDPLVERDLYKLFVDASRGKTAFIVTHRLGSARLADRILVMEAGSIVEDGTHESLLAKGGLYERMYRAQSQWYDRSEKQDEVSM